MADFQSSDDVRGDGVEQQSYGEVGACGGNNVEITCAEINSSR